MPPRPPTAFAQSLFHALELDFEPLDGEAHGAYHAFWAACGLPLATQYQHGLKLVLLPKQHPAKDGFNSADARFAGGAGPVKLSLQL